MKRLRLILLSVALVMALCATAFAVDVKFSGEYFAAGMYQDKTNFMKDGYSMLPPFYSPEYGNGGPSTAFYYQRLRVKTEFIISKGLKLITRFDAMERAWGAARYDASDPTLDRQSAGTRAENENIAFDWAYIEYTSPIGLFSVGIQNDNTWGTVFGNSSVPHGIILYAIQTGGFTAFAEIVKITEQSKTAKYPSLASDNDANNYQGGIVYEWKTGEAGLLGVYYHDKSNRATGGAVGRIYVLQPYAIVQLGPVKIQAEVDYAWGKIKYDDTDDDLKVNNLAGWIDATADWKQFYFGGTVAYVAGNDFSETDKIKGGLLTGGMDWNPTLLLFNNERTHWAGSIPGNWGSTTASNVVGANLGLDDTGMYNAWFFQARAGVRPIEKLDIMASVSYAIADEKTWDLTPLGYPDFVSNKYGTEIDVVATYQITNNLSYLLGAGYLFTGDYFKGFDPYGDAEVADNFLVINKLTLTF